MKIGNLKTVTGVENEKFTPATEREPKELYVEETSKPICSVRFTYIDWLNLKDERIAKCFSGVEIESTVTSIVICFAEELVQLSWEHDVTLQSIVDKFTAELLLGKNPKTSLILTKESLENPYNYKLAKFSEREEKPWSLENTLNI